MSISSQFKKVRIEKGLTQKQVADALGIAEPSYQRYEYGKVVPSALVLIALSEYFGVTLDYLVGKSDFPDYSAPEDLAPFPLLPIRLKKLREEKGFDVFQLAPLVGETPRNYAGYEVGEVLPRMHTLCTIADYFDVSLDYLVGRSEEPRRR